MLQGAVIAAVAWLCSRRCTVAAVGVSYQGGCHQQDESGVMQTFKDHGPERLLWQLLEAVGAKLSLSVTDAGMTLWIYALDCITMQSFCNARRSSNLFETSSVFVLLQAK